MAVFSNKDKKAPLAAPGRWRLATAGLICLFCHGLFGCQERVVYRDHDVEFNEAGSERFWSGQPELIPGLHKEQLFVPLANGDGLGIIHGLQGGTWIHLSVRIGGMPKYGTIGADLGAEVGAIEYKIKLVRTAEGFLEAYDIPIPIKREGAALDALFGSKAVLDVRFSAGDKKVEAKRDVVLEKG